jgi:hypothetical protein
MSYCQISLLLARCFILKGRASLKFLAFISSIILCLLQLCLMLHFIFLKLNLLILYLTLLLSFISLIISLLINLLLLKSLLAKFCNIRYSVIVLIHIFCSTISVDLCYSYLCLIILINLISLKIHLSFL